MTRVKDKLFSVDVRPSKERGQNFLINNSVIDSIITFGDPKEDENIIEIGPGLGALTEELSTRGLKGVVEIEEKFCRELASRFPSLQIVNRDVREVDLSHFGGNLVIFGNLPYSFSTEIVFHLIDNNKIIKRAVLMLQKEFAERMGASPGGRDYGVLSISCQLFCDITLGPIVKGNSFHPPTKVDSRVLKLTMLNAPRYEIPDMAWFKRVVKGAFLQRRKKISNSLKASGFFNEVGQIDEALALSGIDSGRRAETVSIEEFVKLSDALQRLKKG